MTEINEKLTKKMIEDWGPFGRMICAKCQSAYPCHFNAWYPNRNTRHECGGKFGWEPETKAA